MTGTWQLQIIGPGGHIQSVTVNSACVTIGRDPACDVLLDDRKVSARHATITFDGARPQVTDLKSRNGTRLAGIDLAADTPALWGEGAALQIEGYILTLVRLPAPPLAGSAASPIIRALGHVQHGFSNAIHRFERLRSNRYALALLVPVLCFGMGMVTGYRLGTAPTSEQQGGVEIMSEQATPVPTWTPTPVSTTVTLEPTPAPTATRVPVITLSKRPSDSNRVISTRAPVRTPTVASITSSASGGEPVPTEGVAAANLIAVDRVWDSRLSELGIIVDEAVVAPGQVYWRLIKAEWQDEVESGGRHHIYVETLDESGRRVQSVAVRIGWDGGSQLLTPEAKPADEYPMNFDMYKAGYAFDARVDGQASDIIRNLGMGTIEARHYAVHTSYLLTFQLMRK